MIVSVLLYACYAFHAWHALDRSLFAMLYFESVVSTFPVPPVAEMFSASLSQAGPGGARGAAVHQAYGPA